MSKNNLPTDYNLNKLLSYIWEAGPNERSVKLNSHWYAMCDYESPDNDKSVKFFCIDKSLTNKPYTGKQGASNKTQVSGGVYSPTFCLYNPNKQVLMVVRSPGSPTYKSISHYLMKYIKQSISKNDKIKINLIPISSNTKFNSLKDNKYKIKKATFKINPDDLKVQYVKNTDLKDKKKRSKSSVGGFEKIFGSNNNNGLKATISLTNDESTNLDFGTINNLRDTLINDEGVKDFKIRYKQGMISKTLNVMNPKKSSILADELDITKGKGKVLTEEFACNSMYKFYQTPNSDIDKAINAAGYAKKDLTQLKDYDVHMQIPKKDIYKGDKNDDSETKNKGHKDKNK